MSHSALSSNSARLGSRERGGAGRRLDICIVSHQPQVNRELVESFRASGYRVIVTDPDRTPAGTEWESYDIVLLDRLPSGRYPEVPFRLTNFVAALCDSSELSDPSVLRAALKSAAREILPRDPQFHGWKDILGSSRTVAPQVSIRYVDTADNVERSVQIDHSVTVGRDPQNDVVFQHSFVSRRHAKIVKSGSRYRIEDAGSRHGVFVNDARVKEHVLCDGDRIRLGTQGPQMTFSVMLMSENTLQVLESSGLFDTESFNRQVHDIAMLLETFLSLNGDLVNEEILELVLNRSVEFVQADRGVILLRNGVGTPDSAPEGLPLTLAMARNRHGKSLTDREVKISQKIPAEVIETGKGVIFEDLTSSDSEEHLATMGLGIRSAMCVPLKVRSELTGSRRGSSVIGVLYVDSESRGRPFSPRALDALEVLASEVAMAIHSARLYEDSLKKHRFEEEMEIARQIQANIFQRQAHITKHWDLCGTTQPSHHVGGDFLGSFAVDEDRHAVVVGDVSGKGVPAALFSTMLEGLFHGVVSFRSETAGLGDAITDLNRFLLSKSRLQKFVTSIFGFLEPDGKFHYVNAGHNPGLHLRGDGTCEELEPSGTILGMFDDASYSSHVASCETGDVLVLYSDGIPDSRNPAGEEFGLENLRSAAAAARDGSSQEIHSKVLDAFESFLGGTEPRDDVTLMVVKRLG